MLREAKKEFRLVGLGLKGFSRHKCRSRHRLNSFLKIKKRKLSAQKKKSKLAIVCVQSDLIRSFKTVTQRVFKKETKLKNLHIDQRFRPR